MPLHSKPLVVLDLDNTLVHSKIDFLAIRRTAIDRLVERGYIEPPCHPREHSIPEWLAIAETHDPPLAAELWLTVDTYERQGMLAGTVEPDVVPALRRLRADRCQLAILTNNSAASAAAALERFSLLSEMDLVLARGTVEALKPSGAGLRQAHQRLGGWPVYMVGDAYLDGLAAQRSGIGVRFIAFRASTADLLQREIAVWAAIDAFAELPALILGDGSAATPPN